MVHRWRLSFGQIKKWMAKYTWAACPSKVCVWETLQGGVCYFGSYLIALNDIIPVTLDLN